MERRKIYVIKSKLKEWNREHFGHQDKNIQVAQAQLHRLDIKGEEERPEENELEKRRDIATKII
ncbi:hypothetical protein CR513_62469, partial [Mucuna pruriens]